MRLFSDLDLYVQLLMCPERGRISVQALSDEGEGVKLDLRLWDGRIALYGALFLLSPSGRS